jgi:hypothetical protein
MICNGIRQRSIVAMIGSDTKNRFRDIVSSKVLDEWDECEHSRSPLVSAVSNVESNPQQHHGLVTMEKHHGLA